MAQQNVVPSLFGLSPELYQQNRLADLQAQQTIAARTAAGPGTMLNPSLAPLYAQAAQRGQLEGEALRAVGSLLGVEDPELRKIRDVQQMRGQFDVSTVDGLKAFAQALSGKGYTDLAMQAAAEADRREKIQAETTRAAREPDAGVAQLIAKSTPESVAKYKLSGNLADLVLANQSQGGAFGRQEIVSNNGVKAGYVDAKGNFFNNQGRKVSAREFEDSQKSHDSASALIYKLQNITEDDINNAYGSLADYTTVVGGKLVGPTKTLEAQTKINEVGIRSVLNNLSQLKGASSDKEMTQMIKDFPGFQSSPSVMKKWVDRAVATTNNFLQKSEKRYGFDTDYGVENRFTKPDKEQKTTTQTGQQAAIYATNPQTKERIMSTDGGKTWKSVGGK